MINKVILLGNVGADPEIRTFEDGTKVARVRLATTERTFNPKTQEKGERTEWHSITLWRGLAGVTEQYIRKGSQIYIEGRLRNTEWQDANGTKRFGVEIIADDMKMLGGRRQESTTQSNGYSAAPQMQATQTPQPQSSSQANEPFNDDDDLPF